MGSSPASRTSFFDATRARMAARQLRFWPPPRPLEERLGAAFFRNVPAAPGVYLFCGEGPGVLYVGSAANLRRRLATYRVADPERLPRRIVRLLHQVRRIEWDVCPSAAAARFREELLICALAPKFNRAGKVWPREWSRSPQSAPAHPTRNL